MINIAKLVNRMKTLQHFKDLSLADIETIVKAGRIRMCASGEIICMEEEPCSGLFVLLRGHVHLYRLGPDGQELLMHVIRPVIMFNEVAVLDEGPNPFTAIAARDSLVWQACREPLLALSVKFPWVALGFLPVLAARNRALISMCTDFSFRSVRARTAKLLLDLSDCGQQPIIREDHPIYLMSAQISTVPEAISRSLSHFRDLGYISCSRTEIIVSEPQELAVQAQIEPSALTT
jgi:CRP/FNR family transcriptional regulator